MKKKVSFREHHLIQILELFEDQHLPLDLFLSNYFRSHKAIGSKDRKFIADTVYGIIRWKGLLDYLCQRSSWEERYKTFCSFNVDTLLVDQRIPPHIRASFPKVLFQFLSESFGEEKALELCLISNTPAPVTLRVNTLKISRDDLIKKWKNTYRFSRCRDSSKGLFFHEKINFFSLEEFKAGLFEIQDEGSQLVAELVEASPGDQVLDFCSGSGGKTLAFAPQMQNSGQIYLHDIRPRVLLEAKKRLKRAGIQNAQLLSYDDSKKSKLLQKMDWVLLDVPCSGSGTWRRNPDMKWKFDLALLERLILEQRQIVEAAFPFLRPKGKIVYATCSLFPKENEDQVKWIQEKFPVKLLKTFSCLPEKGGKDGFFAAALQQI
jgi:16S rRNA C967 or C1407 C5-methylase (RsmB/RsmF family)